MAILAAGVVVDGRIDVGKEASIRIQADADAVDERYGAGTSKINVWRKNGNVL
jgi:hypothetical protein